MHRLQRILQFNILTYFQETRFLMKVMSDMICFALLQNAQIYLMQRSKKCFKST